MENWIVITKDNRVIDAVRCANEIAASDEISDWDSSQQHTRPGEIFQGIASDAKNINEFANDCIAGKHNDKIVRKY